MSASIEIKGKKSYKLTDRKKMIPSINNQNRLQSSQKENYNQKTTEQCLQKSKGKKCPS